MENSIVQKRWAKATPKDKRNQGNFYTDRDDKYEFSVIGDVGEWDGIVEFTYLLTKNSETGVWKIESL